MTTKEREEVKKQLEQYHQKNRRHVPAKEDDAETLTDDELHASWHLGVGNLHTFQKVARSVEQLARLFEVAIDLLDEERIAFRLAEH